MASATERPMRSLAEAMRPRRDPTPTERSAIEEVRSLALDLDRMALDKHTAFLFEVRKLTTARQRWLATRFTPPGHPAFAPLMALLDGLIAAQDGGAATAHRTKHGVFSDLDLKEAMARIVREAGRMLIAFPVAVVRGEAVYRAAEERSAKIVPFRRVPTNDESTDWWRGGDE